MRTQYPVADFEDGKWGHELRSDCISWMLEEGRGSEPPERISGLPTP
jgi:hypothetical protein